MSKLRNKTRDVALVKQLIRGTQEMFPNGSQTIPVAGTTFTIASLTQAMQDFVDQRQAVEDAKASLKAKLQIEQGQAPAQLVIIRAFEGIVRNSHSGSIDTLAKFGLAPPKARAELTTEQKAVAAAKRMATRVARQTLGKNQKKTIKGSIDARLVVTPVTVVPEDPASS
jgi:hypothetical protein